MTTIQQSLTRFQSKKKDASIFPHNLTRGKLESFKRYLRSTENTEEYEAERAA